MEKNKSFMKTLKRKGPVIGPCGTPALQSGSHLPKKIFICFNNCPSKMMKNVFYFILKALFVLKIFKFLSTFWSCRKNDLVRKTRLTSKSLTSQPGLQTILIYILPYISQIKGNQTMKVGQIIEYN